MKTLILLRIPLVLTLLVCSSCRTLPSLQPFADSTAELSLSVRAAGRATVADAQELAADWDREADRLASDEGDAAAKRIREQAAELTKSAAELDAAWTATSRMMTAVADYSSSLAEIAAAGKQGRASAEAVGSSLKALLDGVGASFPVSGEVLALSTRAYGYVAEARAAKSLAQALREAQPAVDEVAQVVRANLEHAQRINRMLYLGLVTSESDPARAGFDVGAERGLLRRANAALDQLRAEIQKALKEADPIARDQALAQLAERSRGLQAIVAGSEAKLGPVNAAIAQTRKRGQQRAELLTATLAAVDEWASYHRRLLAGLEKKQVPSAQALAAAAADIRELLNLIRTKS